MNGFHGGTAIWLFYYFMKKQSTTVLSSKIALKSTSLHKHHKEGTLTMYWEQVNYFLKMYASDDVGNETDAGIMRLTQLWSETSI